MEERDALPDTPFGGDRGNVDVVDPSPPDVGEVACDLGKVVRLIEHLVCIF